MKRRLIKNAVANVGRGGTAAIVALALPPILIRHMVPATYAVWVLILQVTAYLGFLDFGLQTAVGRYIALAEEQNDKTARDTTFSTALSGLTIACLVGSIFIVSVSFAAHSIFPSIPAKLLPAMRWAILIAGLSTAFGLPASAWNGVFVGLQRYEIPAITIATGRAISSCGLIITVLHGGSLVTMAWIVAGSNLLIYLSQFVAFRTLVPDIGFSLVFVTRTAVRELAGYCLSLTIWSISTLLITGFDLILVGRFDFGSVAIYSAAAVLISFLGGLQTSIFSVIMPHSAALQASGNSSALGELLLKSTKLGTIILLLTGLPLSLFAFEIIRIWLGLQYATKGESILVILVIGNIIRLLGVPYASILVGTGQQRLIILSPLLEGISNLAASVLLGQRFGAKGVAWGTLIGAVVGMTANFVYSIPKTQKWINVSSIKLLVEISSNAAICAAPLVLLFPLHSLHSRYWALSRSFVLGLCMALGCILFMKKTRLHET